MVEQHERGHAVFDPARSFTFERDQGASFNITYGDDSHAEGVVAHGTVNIGGAIAHLHPIGLATSSSGSFTHDIDFEGIIGLASGVVKAKRQPAFFENVMSSLEPAVFTASLSIQAPLNDVPVNASQGW
ncbi:MAG: hypothetical protein M1826_005436 [Phylliscum demangeonii]|nr:MAG: hypothetical protein M1826_005436 [Phylliscum demangeonii]